MWLFLKVMAAEFIAEMGDKTQLMLMALTSKYKIRDIVLGTAAAILILNGMAVLAGGLVGSLVPDWLIKEIAAFAFLYFAFSSVGPDDEGEEQVGERKVAFAPLAVGLTFFLAELGDKTQLTAVTFGANEGLDAALPVWLGCSIGLFAADMLGMLLGMLLKNKMPETFLKSLAFLLFAFFGIYTLHQGLRLRCGADSGVILPVLLIVTLVFLGACVGRLLWKRRRSGE